MSGATSRHGWLTPNDAPTVTRCRRVRIPDSEEWIAIVSGALVPLMYVWNWELFGTLTPEEAAARAQAMVLEYFQDDCMIGSIFPYATANPPYGCIPCDGSTFDRADYPMLYDALDPAFIVDADTFRTPDRRGRTVIGAESGIDLTPRTVGETGGAETHTLNVQEMPEHDHSTQPHSHTINMTNTVNPILVPGSPDLSPVQSVIPGVSTNDATVILNTKGDGHPHNNMPPFIALKYAMVAR